MFLKQSYCNVLNMDKATRVVLHEAGQDEHAKIEAFFDFGDGEEKCLTLFDAELERMDCECAAPEMFDELIDALYPDAVDLSDIVGKYISHDDSDIEF